MESFLTNLKDGCRLVLQYFGIFRHPLTLEEIHLFNPVRSTQEKVLAALDELLAESIIFHSDTFYMPVKNEEWVHGRRKANAAALKLLARSGRYASVISACPFVRGIAISGSLSKFSVSDQPDIDYFIITASDRLWIARTLLHLFKKLTFLTGHQHFFCMNYFIDEKALLITHPNRYTAIEVATLLPVFNTDLLLQFYNANGWVKEYLPNHPGLVNLDYVKNEKKQHVKKILEGIIGFIFPDRMNLLLMRFTDRKWRRKWSRAGYPEQEYDRAFLTDLHISKNHPVDYEKKVLASLVEHNISGN
ncbi:MAG: hypothetical protein MUC31_00720 [Bacteroidales bacterium]|nr:hypothetical protein [Bacteroidales bacterium]